MEILVTGATGFIGSALVPALAAAGHAVRQGQVYSSGYQARVNLHRPEPPHFIPPHATVHLAANTRDEGDWQTNILGTAHVVDWTVSGHRLVFASSIAATAPRDAYEAEKALGEQIVRARRDVTGVILRLGNVFGPGPQSRRCVLNQLARQAVAGEPMRLYGNVDGVRDYVHVGDVVTAICRALDGEVPAGTYDVGTATVCSLRDAAAQLTALTGTPAVAADDAYGRHHPVAMEARWLPGWAPRVALREGLEGLVAALRAEREAEADEVAA